MKLLETEIVDRGDFEKSNAKTINTFLLYILVSDVTIKY